MSLALPNGGNVVQHMSSERDAIDRTTSLLVSGMGMRKDHMLAAIRNMLVHQKKSLQDDTAGARHRLLCHRDIVARSKRVAHLLFRAHFWTEASEIYAAAAPIKTLHRNKTKFKKMQQLTRIIQKAHP